MPNRNLSKIQEALNELTTVEKYINELEYYRKHLYSPNHSKGTCNSTVALITQLNTDHANLVNALITYGIQYESDDASLAAGNNPDYKYSGSTSSFTYTSAPEHQKTFWEKTVSQVVLGDFSDDVTWLGTTANVLLSFTGIDLVLDIRDTCGSVSKKDGWGTALNLLTLLPVVGVLGELGKVAKHGDDIVDAGSTIIRHGDDIVDGGSSIIKNGDKTIKGGLDTAADAITDAARKTQKSIIESVENSVDGSKGLSTLQKGNYGEMKMDDFFESQGYKRISTDRVTDLNGTTHQGIDGVYYNPDGHPPFIIGEAKYGSSRLSDTLDGKQMSDNWVDKRLSDAVGQTMADKITLQRMFDPNAVQKRLINISEDGKVIPKILDESANIVE